MQRNLWKETYASIPRFGCPRCSSGKLVRKTDIAKLQPKHVEEELYEAGLIGELEHGRFTTLLLCDHGFCGEVVSVAGEYEEREQSSWDSQTEEEVQFTVTKYWLHSLAPAPRIIDEPEKLNSESKWHLQRAFALFWVDRGACANSLRITVEYLLDQLDVPREGPKGNKKNVRLDLFDRITLLGERRPGHDVTLNALRMVGNAGSHEGEADFEEVLDCFALLEQAMIDLIEERREKLAAKAQLIIDRRKKP